MPRYLMFDHGGVLDGEMSAETPNANDLILSDIGEGINNILKNGVTIIEQLTELIEHCDYQLVFHSKNQEVDQLRILRQLQQACLVKNIFFPTVIAMAVFDPVQYKGVLPTAPVIIKNKPHGITVIGYGQEGEEKSCVRQALTAALKISAAEYRNQIVFDDGPNIIVKARDEGYQAYRIGNDAGAISLYQVVAEIYARESRQVSSQQTLRP